MSVVTRTPAAPKPAPPALHIAKPDYRTITVDSRKDPQETLLSHIEGASWTVNYYSQVLDRDNGSAGQGLGREALYQQYKLVQSMEIRVTGDLSTNQNPETGEMEVTGTATLYPFIIPNKGDMFVADLLDGRPGVFQVTDSRRLAIMRETCHSIDYILVSTADQVVLDDLERKKVQHVYFERDFIYHGQNPILVADDYQNLSFLRANYSLLIDRYFKRFYSKEYATLIMPGQSSVVYDGFLVKAMYTHLNTSDSLELTKMRKLNADDDQLMQSDSLWTLLTARNRAVFDDIFTRCGIVHARSFTLRVMYEGIAFSGVKEVIYPTDAVLKVDNGIRQIPKGASEFVASRDHHSTRRMGALEDVTKQPKCIKPAMSLGYYVLSQAFYENDRTENAQSMLELVLQDYIDRKEISYGRIRQLVEDASLWNSIDSFYYIPILIILLKGVILSI